MTSAPLVCRALAAVVAVGCTAWASAAAAGLFPVDRDGTLVVLPAWAAVVLLAVRRASGPLGRGWRAVGWGLAAVVPAGCAAAYLGMNGLSAAWSADPSVPFVLGWWLTVAIAGVIGLGLDGTPEPANDQ